MDRFGSHLFRIVWVLTCLLLVGLVLGSVQSVDGQLVVFGTAIPLGFENFQPEITSQLVRFISAAVPAITLFGAFVPLSEWLATGAKGERFRGLVLGLPVALLHGLLISQAAILPILAFSSRVLGSFLPTALLQADLKAILLGLQLLLWALALAQVLKSARGMALLLAFALSAVGRVLAWLGEWAPELALPKSVGTTSNVLANALPTERLPADPLAAKTVLLALGVPFLLTALLMLLPARAAKAAKAPKKTK